MNLNVDIVERLIDKLDEYELQEDAWETSAFIYGTDFASQSLTCSAYVAKEWICEYFDDIADYVDEYNKEFNELLNPFQSPEMFMLDIVQYATYKILSDEWEEGITKEQMIEKLQEDFL